MKMGKKLVLFVIVAMLFIVLMGCTSIRGGGWIPSSADGEKVTFAFTANTGKNLGEVEVVDGISSASVYEAKGNFQLNDRGEGYKLHGEVLYQKGFNYGFDGSGLIAFVDTDKDGKYEKLMKLGGYDAGEGANESDTPQNWLIEVAPGISIPINPEPMVGDYIAIEVFNIADYDGTGKVEFLDYLGETGPHGEPAPTAEYKHLGPIKGGNIQFFEK